MTRRKRRNHSSAFKAKVALSAVILFNALSRSSLEQPDVHPASRIWKKRLVEGARSVRRLAVEAQHRTEVEKLHSPRSNGCLWRTIFYRCSRATDESIVEAEFTRSTLVKTMQLRALDQRSSAYYRGESESEPDV